MCGCDCLNGNGCFARCDKLDISFLLVFLGGRDLDDAGIAAFERDLRLFSGNFAIGDMESAMVIPSGGLD